MSKKEKYLRKFDKMLRCKYNSKATLRNYLLAADRFLEWCIGRTGEPRELVTQYLAWGLKANCARTHNLNRAAIVVFFKLVKGIKITVDDVPRKREPKTLPRILPKEKIQGAISKTMNIKHRMELIFFFACGMRLSEVAFLRRKNIMLKRRSVWLEDTKGQKHRIVPIPESAISLISDFVRGMQPDEYIFKGQCEQGHISKKSLENVVSQALAKVGVDGYPHLLRHSFATEQILAGQNVFKVQSWLGHKNIKTTGVYVHLAETQLDEVADLLTNENYTNILGS